MNLYLLIQNELPGPDVYDSCVVCAESIKEARNIVPDVWCQYINGTLRDDDGKPVDEDTATWAIHKKNVQVVLLGTAKPSLDKGLIISSFID